MRVFLNAIVVLAFAGFATAEDKKEVKIDAKKLIGKWEPAEEVKNAKIVIEFSDNGKMTVQYTIDGKVETMEGTYKVDGNKIEMSKAGSKDVSRTLIVTKLTDDELVSKDTATGKDGTLKKIKPAK
jgi:uncharacterized protein (TIGR03066 family)